MIQINGVIKSGLVRLFVGFSCAGIIYYLILKDLNLNKGNVFVFAISAGIFTFCLAQGLSGLLVIALGKSYNDLWNTWNSYSIVKKLIILIVGSILFYISVFAFGVLIFR